MARTFKLHPGRKSEPARVAPRNLLSSLDLTPVWAYTRNVKNIDLTPDAYVISGSGSYTNSSVGTYVSAEIQIP